MQIWNWQYIVKIIQNIASAQVSRKKTQNRGIKGHNKALLTQSDNL
jgi:hypothetical protein